MKKRKKFNFKKYFMKRAKEDSKEECCHRGKCGFYCLPFIGTAIYYIQIATSPWEVFTGILKAIFWPATLIYNLFKFLGA